MTALRQWLPGGVLVLLAAFAANAAAADSPTERFREGQRLMQGGDLDAALERFDDLRAEFPQDADYSLGRAQVLRLQHRNAEALAELEETTRLAPDYEDAWRLRFALLLEHPQAVPPAELEAMRETASKQFPLAAWWRRRDAPAQWSVLLGAGFDDLSDNLPGWNEQFVELRYEPSQRRSVGIRLGRNERYVEADYSLGVAARQTWASGWFTGADLAVADDAAFQPDLGFGLFAGTPFGDGWTGTFGYRRKSYPAETVDSIYANVEKYRGNFRFAYTLNGSRLQNASGFFGHAFTTNWYYSDDASIGVTISTGQEAESLGNGQVLETDVSGLSLSGRYRLSERFGLQWWLGTHEQGDFYRRRFLGMAVSIRL